MSPEVPPPNGPEQEPFRSGGQATFGPEAQASVDRSLATVRDPDDALRILQGVKESGAAFAAYLMLTDTNLAAPDLIDRFYDAYNDAWEHFAEFRRDILDGLGWLDAITTVMTEQGIPEDHLTWNVAAIDKQIFDAYDAVHLDGWWHIFHK
jgi:hypothetical protein